MSNFDAKLDQLIEQYVSFTPDSACIHLFEQRMVLMQGQALSTLRRELSDQLGHRQTKAMLTRLGYNKGLHYFEKIRDVTGDDPELLLAMAMRLAELEGFVLNKPIDTLQLNIEDGRFYGDYYWSNSWEAEAHIEQFGVGNTSSCWMMEGFASGFSTAILGRPVVWREVECAAMGHASCRVVGKPLEEWDDDGTTSFFKAEEFVDLPRTRRADERLHRDSDSPLSELVGASVGFNAVVRLLKRVANTDTTVLLLGESGVGKERFARTLHAIGDRADRPWISVNCAAIPADLVEAELFGVEKGAFTGATASRPGRFERADGGTLFLDEIGSLPYSAQGKLLRALQEGEVERVGGTAVKKVNVRIIAAANQDLREAASAGSFRTDLFYRLNVYPIVIPPLRERRDDIPLLLNVFLHRYAKKIGKTICGTTRRAIDALSLYDWPGNVRELENLVERACILVEPDEAIDIQHLFSAGERLNHRARRINASSGRLTTQSPLPHTEHAPTADTIDRLLSYDISLSEMEDKIIDRALAVHNGNVSATAKALKMGRGQLQYKLGKRDL